MVEIDIDWFGNPPWDRSLERFLGRTRALLSGDHEIQGVCFNIGWLADLVTEWTGESAQRLPLRSPRMPDFDELPVPAQNEIRRARGETSDEHPQKARTSLLQRLANVGLGRRDEEHEAPVAGRSSGPDLSQMPSLPARKPVKPIPPEFGGDPVSEYGRRPAPQGLDSHGRTAAVPSQGSEDHLDIPAFLRRQAN